MKIFTGEVIAKTMDKTATVAVGRVIVHPVYKKRFKRVKKYHAHDELGSVVGQKVKFVASKPYSKTKKWKLIEIVGSSESKMKQRVKSTKLVKKSKK